MRAIGLTFLFVLFSVAVQSQSSTARRAPLEVVAQLDTRPGNVAVSPNGRVFCTMHPLGQSSYQLVEIKGVNDAVPFPNLAYQNTSEEPSMDKLDTPLGIRIDGNNVLWIIDMGLNLGTTRLFGFDLGSGKEVFRFDFPEEIANKESFIQDLAVDEVNGWVYLADIANPGILALNTNSKEVRRFADPAVEAEPVDLVIDGKLIYFQGAPASVAVNPITLSRDKNTLFFGAMSGTTWYQLPAELFRSGANDYALSKAIKVAGPKPVSDGVATGDNGAHYFTNLNHYGVDVLTPEGDLLPLIRDPRLNWPDNVALQGDDWLYIAVNQLHKTPAFTGGEDEGEGPYFIYRFSLKH